MVIKSVLASFAAACLFAAPLSSMAHGKAITLGKLEEAARAFVPGARLEPFKTESGGGAVSWLLAVGPEGRKLGLVGVAKEETEHGYLVQATAVGLDGKILSVLPLKVMEDEKAMVISVTRIDGWWREGSTVKAEGAGLILIKSAGNTAKEARSILGDMK